MTKRPRLVALADREALRAAGVPYTPGTLRQMRCKGTMPRLFVTLVGRVFIDLDEWDRAVLAPALAERDARAERIETVKAKVTAKALAAPVARPPVRPVGRPRKAA